VQSSTTHCNALQRTAKHTKNFNTLWLADNNIAYNTAHMYQHMYICLFSNLSLCLSPALLLDRARARNHTLTLPLSHSLFVLLSLMQPPPHSLRGERTSTPRRIKTLRDTSPAFSSPSPCPSPLSLYLNRQLKLDSPPHSSLTPPIASTRSHHQC